MSSFERNMMICLGILVLGLVAVVFIIPLHQNVQVRESSQKINIENTENSNDFVKTVDLDQSESIELKVSTVNFKNIEENSGEINVQFSAQILDNFFSKIGYDLESVTAGNSDVPRFFLATMPGDIGKISEIKQRKALFFSTILPIILQINEEINHDRERLINLKDMIKSRGRLTPIDRLWLIVMAEQYKVARNDLEALMSRVDLIPPSLALAQAAAESGWGTSRFVRQGNAIFGEWTEDADIGITPREREAGKTHKIRKFKSLIESARAYVKNLNTHRAYKQLRVVRSSLRRKGLRPTGEKLARELKNYSERGVLYINTLVSIIKVNNLKRLDNVNLMELKTSDPPI